MIEIGNSNIFLYDFIYYTILIKYIIFFTLLNAGLFT